MDKFYTWKIKLEHLKQKTAHNYCHSMLVKNSCKDLVLLIKHIFKLVVQSLVNSTAESSLIVHETVNERKDDYFCFVFTKLYKGWDIAD